MQRNYQDRKDTEKSAQERAKRAFITNSFVPPKSYLHKRLSEIGLTADSPLLYIEGRPIFTADHYGNIQIHYAHLDGKRMFYHLPKEKTSRKYTPETVYGTYLASECQDEFIRIRRRNGKPKYITPKGAPSKPYFTALFQCFLNPETKLHQNDFKKVVIVEGEFKAWALCLRGVPAIGVSGISMATLNINAEGLTKAEFKEQNQSGYFIPTSAKFRPEIAAFIERVKPDTFVQLHDGDNFNNKGNRKRSRNFLASVRRFRQATEKHEIGHVYAYSGADLPKGIDDFLHTSTNTEQKQIIAELLSGGGDFITSHAVGSDADFAKIKRLFDLSHRNTLPFEKYLSEHREYIKDLLLNDNGKVKGMFAPTGSGKNETLYSLTREIKTEHSEKRIFIGYPDNKAVAAKTAEYSNPNNNHSGLDLNILAIDQHTDGTTKARIASSIDQHDCVNVCTNSFKWVKDFVRKGDIVILDEVHKGITQSEIAPLDDIHDILTCGANVVVMTGTPFDSLIEEYEIESHHFERKDSPTVNVKCIELTKGERVSFNFKQAGRLYVKAAKNWIDTLTPSGGKLHFVFLNNKEHLRLLSKHAKRRDFDVDFLYSGCEGEAWEHVKRGKPIPLSGKPKIIFCTCFAYDAVNITNAADELSRVAIFGEKYTENDRQTFGRFRNAMTLEVDWFLVAADKRKGFGTSYKRHRGQWQKDYDQAKLLLSARNCSFISEKTRKSLVNDVGNVLTSTGKFNRLACVSDYERKKADYETNAQKFDRLAEYCCTTVYRVDVAKVASIFGMGNDTAETNHAQTEMELQKLAEAKEMARQFVIDLVKEHGLYAFGLLLKHSLKSEFKADLRRICGDEITKSITLWELQDKIKLERRHVRILTQFAERIVSMADTYEIEGILQIVTAKNFKRIKMELDTARVADGERRTEREQLNGILYDLIRKSSFEIGQTYSRGEIIDELKGGYKNFPHLWLKDGDFVKQFKMLFEWKRATKGTNKHAYQAVALITHEMVMERYGLVRKFSSFGLGKDYTNDPKMRTKRTA